MEGKVYAQVYSLIRVERDGLIEALRELSRIGCRDQHGKGVRDQISGV